LVISKTSPSDRISETNEESLVLASKIPTRFIENRLV
jgi:hypothetical protein